MLTLSCKANQCHHTFNPLPIEILVLQGYLSLRDISSLDIATCDVDLRSQFLNSLQSVKIRDDTELGRGDDFVTWIIKHQMKLLNFKGHVRSFTKKSADKMAAGQMKLGAIDDVQLNCSSFDDDIMIKIAECCGQTV
jgi:hypothetical protein